MVVRAAPFQVITSPLAKPTPVAVNVKSAVPIATVNGLSDSKLNEPFPVPLPVIVRFIVPDVVVSGFIARIDTVPGFAICAAGICAVSCVFETTVVVRAAPSHRIWVPAMKFVPFTVRVKLALPAATVEGVMELIVGVTIP